MPEQDGEGNEREIFLLYGSESGPAWPLTSSFRPEFHPDF
jgi:hypothetical protein